MKKKLIGTARGILKADIIFKNAKVVDVLTASIYEADVAVVDGLIAGVGEYTKADKIIDLEGKYICPAFINSHCHVESSMAMPSVYCVEELSWGVTTLITDPHEIANVSGVEGVSYMLENTKNMPINYYVQVPSCVPATPFEHSGSTLDILSIAEIAQMNGVLGMGEMMNVPAVLSADGDVLAKLDWFRNKPIDGHAPQLTGKDLQGYVIAGINTDHEATTWKEAKEKLRSGMYVLVRQGSASQNLKAIMEGVIAEDIDTTNMAFCTDDKHLADIRKEGTIRYCVVKSIEMGMKPLKAIQMATINAARIYGLKHLGSITAGKQADFIVCDDITKFENITVYYKGQKMERIVANRPNWNIIINGSVNIKDVTKSDLELAKKEKYPIIKMIPHQIITDKEELPYDDAMTGLEKGDICKIAVLERHHATGYVGVGLLKGYGLKNGAIATTVAHDSHNMIVVGTNDEDMLLAINELKNVQGGYTIAQNGKIIDTLPLNIAGLMSDLPAEKLINRLDDLTAKAHEVGVSKDVDPFITLSFMALPVIPKIRITDMGVFDVESFSFIK